MGGEKELLDGDFSAGQLAPHQEAILHEGTVISGSETVAFGTKMIKDWTKSGKEPLCMPRGFETPHEVFSLPCWLVRALRSIVESFVLTMLDASQDLAFRCSITLQLIGNDHAWNVL